MKKLTALCLLLFLGACARWPVQEFKLNGFQDGKMRMKYVSTIFVEDLPDGSSGYRLVTNINYSVGAKDRRETVKTTLLTKDFHLVGNETRKTNNQTLIESKVRIEGDQLILWQKEGDQPESERKVAVTGPVYDVHPLLYAKDLLKAGSEKKYAVLHEAKAAIVEITIKYIGPANLDIKGKKVPGKHFQIESTGNPGKFDDFYLDKKTNEVVRIDMEPLQFLHAE